jgi:hypothetical protein
MPAESDTRERYAADTCTFSRVDTRPHQMPYSSDTRDRYASTRVSDMRYEGSIRPRNGCVSFDRVDCDRNSQTDLVDLVQHGDRPGESWPAGQLRALSCALDKSDSRLEPCTRSSTCDDVSKLPAQAGCGRPALSAALRLRNRRDMAPERAIRREGLKSSLGRSSWPLLGVHSNRTSHNLGGGIHDHGTNSAPNSGRGSSIQGQAAGFLPALRMHDCSWPGPVRSVPRNAVAPWLAAQELLRRPRRHSGTPLPARRPLRQAEGRRYLVHEGHHRFPGCWFPGKSSLGDSTFPTGWTARQWSGHRWLLACGWRASGGFSLAPAARRALQVLGLSLPTRVPILRVHSSRVGWLHRSHHRGGRRKRPWRASGSSSSSSLAPAEPNRADPSRRSRSHGQQRTFRARMWHQEEVRQGRRDAGC